MLIDAERRGGKCLEFQHDFISKLLLIESSSSQMDGGGGGESRKTGENERI
jgi:hypothetical protein